MIGGTPISDIRYLLTVDDKGSATIKQFDGTIKTLATTTSKQATPAVSGFQAAYGKLTATIAVGMAAYQGASRVISGLTGFVKSSVTAAIEAETAQNNLRLALETTGREVELSLAHYSAYADSLMQITRFDDEAIKSTQALLLQLTDLNQKGMDEATKGAIGLASVFKIDLDTAARIVAKATEGNVEMLQRYIPKLRDTKDETKKAAIAHEELAKMFERAKGEMDTYAGRVNNLQKNYGELKETLGTIVTENKAVNDTMFVLTETIKKLNDAAKGLNETQEKHVKIWDFFGPVAAYKALSGVMSHYADTLRKAQAEEAAFATAFENGVGKAWQFIADKAPTVTKAIEDWWKAINKTKEETKKTTDSTIGFTKAIQTNSAELALAGVNLLAYLGGLQDAPAYYNAILPPARDMTEVLKQAGSATYELSYKAERSTTQVKNYFDGLYNDIATGWANTISGFVSGTITLENIFHELWTDLRDSFFRVVGEMTAGWIIDKFKSLFSGIGKAASDSVDSVSKSIGGAAAGVGQGLLGSLSAVASIVTAVASVAALFKGPEKSTDVTFWLKLIYEDLGSNIMLKFDGLKESVDLSRDTANPLLEQIRNAVLWFQNPIRAIESYTSALKNVQFGAQGLDMTVQRPTMFMAGEHAPERVTITPRGQAGGGEAGYLHADIYIGGDKVESKIVKLVRRSAQLGRLTFPEKAVV